MRLARFALIGLILILSACSSDKFKSYSGPQVTQLLIDKSDRTLYLFHHDRILKKYAVSFGFTATGHKQFEGDGKTPEGLYYIDRRNPRSAFHLSLGISYPNQADRDFAKARGRSPGGDIFIHGQPNGRRLSRSERSSDWTAGCIALTNRQMERVYAMVRDGTPIIIRP